MQRNNARMDIASRKKEEKSHLFRFVLQGGAILLDEGSSLPGRGVYLEKSQHAIDVARKKRLLARLGKIEDEERFFEDLSRRISNG